MKQNDMHGENIAQIEELEPKVAPGTMMGGKPVYRPVTIVWEEV
jgi:hypothetical protein